MISSQLHARSTVTCDAQHTTLHPSLFLPLLLEGVTWFNHSVVLGPTATVVQPREDVACAAPVVWRDAATGTFRMVYSAIGTKWGFYSLAQAVSADGYTWHRGAPSTADDDLILAPSNASAQRRSNGNLTMMSTAEAGSSWDSQMVEYSSLWHSVDDGTDKEGAVSRMGLFYVGNGYGRTGIGYTESEVRSTSKSVNS